MDLLKQKFFEKSSVLKTEMKALLKEHGNKKIDEVVLRQAFGGARGVKMMIWETSSLDAHEGIRFRGYSIPQLKELLPKGNGKEPLPEGLFWLMLVGELPTEEQVKWVTDQWAHRSNVPDHTYRVLDALDADTHPMTQFTIAISSMQTTSVFAHRYAEGMKKTEYWDAVYEDAMNLIAMMRLYMTIHADHEGGNASAHTAHLVGSTLSDPYHSYAGGMASLAGPLHGLANQEVIKWVFKMLDALGTKTPTKKQISDYVHSTLASGQVIPGYGHAVLRKPDPRFTAQKVFAEEYLRGNELVETIWKIFEVVPPILQGLGKVKNPWPNVDAHSGALLVHYGMKEYSFYTVLFGVSRALGVLAAQCWSRALGMPLERPKSLTSDWVKEFIAKSEEEA